MSSSSDEAAIAITAYDRLDDLITEAATEASLLSATPDSVSLDAFTPVAE